MKKRIAIVTGATGGLGAEFVRQLLEWDIEEIWAVARNAEKLAALRQRYGERIVPAAMDLSDTVSLTGLEGMLSEQQPVVAYLVNNAGIARMGKYDTFTPEEISRTVDVNCKTPILLMNLCIPYMERGRDMSVCSLYVKCQHLNVKLLPGRWVMRLWMRGIRRYL